jgi:hypothetical protein
MIENLIKSYNRIIVTRFCGRFMSGHCNIHAKFHGRFQFSFFYHQSKPIVTFISRIADILFCMMYYMLNFELFLYSQLVAQEKHTLFYVMDAQLFLRLQHYLTRSQNVS